MKVIADGNIVTACNASIEEVFHSRCWIISTTDHKFNKQSTICLKSQNKNTVKIAEVRTILELIWSINSQTKHLNRGKVIVCNNNMKLLNKINYSMVKAIEFSQEAVSLASKILTIIRKSIIRHEFQYVPSNKTQVKQYSNNSLVYLIQ